jgi:uncharacterized protein HemX
MAEVTTAVQEAMTTAVQEAAVQAVETTKKGVVDKAVTVIKSNKTLIMWTLVFAAVAAGGIYCYEQQKNKVVPVEEKKSEEDKKDGNE